VQTIKRNPPRGLWRRQPHGVRRVGQQLRGPIDAAALCAASPVVRVVFALGFSRFSAPSPGRYLMCLSRSPASRSSRRPATSSPASSPPHFRGAVGSECLTYATTCSSSTSAQEPGVRCTSNSAPTASRGPSGRRAVDGWRRRKKEHMSLALIGADGRR
jgi:hypothetical protein